LAAVLAGLASGALLLLGLADTAWAQEQTFRVAGAEAAAGATALTWAFRLLGGVTVLFAVAVVFTRNPVIAALFLVATLFCTGGIYVMLHATFLGAIQVLVYAGAIMVLFIFVVMSVGHPEREELGLARGTASKILGLVAAAVLLGKLWALVRGPSVPEAGLVTNDFGDVRDVGTFLFSDYLLPFEALSILLLVSIVGAVMITRRRRAATAQEAQR
jgi:NADH-quinone oxidoreductase subunit J